MRLSRTHIRCEDSEKGAQGAWRIEDFSRFLFDANGFERGDLKKKVSASAFRCCFLGRAKLSSPFLFCFLSPLERTEEIKISTHDEKWDPNAQRVKEERGAQKKKNVEVDDGRPSIKINKKCISYRRRASTSPSAAPAFSRPSRRRRSLSPSGCRRWPCGARPGSSGRSTWCFFFFFLVVVGRRRKSESVRKRTSEQESLHSSILSSK